MRSFILYTGKYAFKVSYSQLGEVLHCYDRYDCRPPWEPSDLYLRNMATSCRPYSSPTAYNAQNNKIDKPQTAVSKPSSPSSRSQIALKPGPSRFFFTQDAHEDEP